MGPGLDAALIAAGSIALEAAEFFERGILGSFFDGAGFSAPGSLWNFISGEGLEQVQPELRPPAFFVRTAELDVGDGPLAEGVERAFEAQTLRRNTAAVRGLEHEPAQQIVCGQTAEQFARHQRRALACQGLHAQSGF